MRKIPRWVDGLPPEGYGSAVAHGYPPPVLEARQVGGIDLKHLSQIFTIQIDVFLSVLPIDHMGHQPKQFQLDKNSMAGILR